VHAAWCQGQQGGLGEGGVACSHTAIIGGTEQALILQLFWLRLLLQYWQNEKKKNTPQLPPAWDKRGTVHTSAVRLRSDEDFSNEKKS